MVGTTHRTTHTHNPPPYVSTGINTGNTLNTSTGTVNSHNSDQSKFPLHNVNIYPPIGIARVGNSLLDDGWFYGPENPGHFDEPEGGFKDKHGAVKRQAARFRVYGTNGKGEVIEANEANGYELVWTVQVANKKASWYTFMGRTQEGAFQTGYTTLRNPKVQPDKLPDERSNLIVDSGLQDVKYGEVIPLVGHFYGSKTKSTEIYLGEARTDDYGRLVVLAGRGESKSIANEDEPYPYILTDFDSPDWIDDTSDGWISVHITNKKDKTSYDVPVKARVIGTTPKFANGIYAPTTLYDLMEEVYEREKRKEPGYDVGPVDWYKHIWPLLRRPPLLSWVNIKADGGHGPNGRGNFFLQDWQDSLSDPDSHKLENSDTRKGILGRIRLPETDSKKYDQARNGQAFPYFMPWISGDGGRTTDGDPSTFTSVTELQYDRLVKWSKGEFTQIDVPEYEDFNQIPVDKQPAALAEAALEQTIGAPLFPGIELSWNAEKSEIYQLDKPFTIQEDVKPGDLTKYLSLPWQSDFYMCRSYWWPSVRPDSIVTEETYFNVLDSVIRELMEKTYDITAWQSITLPWNQLLNYADNFPGDSLLASVAQKLTDRVPWERGLHLNYTDEFPDQPFFANTDMAENWHRLGFIVQRPSFGPEPIFVETQRGDILRPKKAIRPDLHSLEEKLPCLPIPELGGFPIPMHRDLPMPMLPIPRWGPDRHDMKDSLESLREHLQAAIEIELSTIPLYLFGMYSIKIPAQYAKDPRYYDPVIGAIRGVVGEEMLHLSLAGNILRAIGGHPKLYDAKSIPRYPMNMAGRYPYLRLDLKRADKDHLKTFIAVEIPGEPGAEAQYDNTKSLSQFYAALKNGLTYLNHKYPDLFDKDTAKYQFAPGLGYQPHVRDAGGSIIVTNLKTAIEAITVIVSQGEGNPGPYADKAKLEKDHYDIFKDLKEGDTTWETYPVLDNPVTSSYWSLDERIYHVSLTFDAAYCFLLRTIETLWYVDKEDERYKLVLGNLFSIMMGVLKPLAQFLVTQPIGSDGRHAAPCFGYYKFRKGESELKQLQDEMQATIDSYLSETAETRDQVPVTNYGLMLETLLPIQTSIKALAELDFGSRYATQIFALAKDFTLCCAAAALFYVDKNDDTKHGLRIEATSIMREFIANVQFGKDPEGILFYNYLSDLESDDDVYYSVFYNSETPRAIRVDFCTEENDSTTRFASFLTKDTNNIDTNLLKNGSGKWVEQPTGTCSAKLHKVSSGKKVTLTLKPIAKKVTFEIADADVTKTKKKDDGTTVKVTAKELDIKTNGIFHFKSIGDLKDTCFANYDSDRLLFYLNKSDSEEKYIGVFFPDSDEPLEIDNTGDGGVLPKATWASG